MCYSLGGDFSAIGLEHANTCAVGVHLDAHAIGLTGRCIEDSHVGLVDRHGLSTMPPVVPFMGLAGVLLDQVDTFHDNVGVILAQRNNATLTLVTAAR